MEKINTVYRTTDYSLFKRLEGNRSVLQMRVKRITASIKKVGWIQNPVIVNEKMEVIEGQGRLEALKTLGMPVDYIIVPGIGLNECVALNANTTNWSVLDYVQSYAEIGNLSYIYLLQLIKSYGKKVNLSVILNAATGRITTENKVIREGGFECTTEMYNNAIKLLDYLTLYKKIFDHIGGNKDLYFYAIAFCYQHPKVDNEKLLKKVEQNALDLMPIAKMKQALEVIEEIYNKRNRDKVYIETEYRKAMDNKYNWYSKKYR